MSLRDGAQLAAGTRGQGNAGNITIDLQGNLVLTGNSTALFSNLEDRRAVGKGGDIKISAENVEINDGAQIIANSFGDGDAGNVEITARGHVYLDNVDFKNGRSSGIFTGNGTPNSRSISTGNGGDIAITSPSLVVNNGAVINARTVNDKPGGVISINLGELMLLSGGQIFTTSEAAGRAGNILLSANEKVSITGVNQDYVQLRQRFGNRVTLTSPNSALSVQANGTGPAGNILLNTPRLTLNKRGQIIADSDAATGGNIFIGTKPNLPEFANLPTIRPDTILLRNNSLISATAGRDQGAGDGGNINIKAPFVIGLPNNNSDIVANAFSGSGGNIDIDANAIFNLQRNGNPNLNALRNNRTNDISATSQFGSSGTLSLSGLNTDPTQSISELPTDFINPADSISRRCGADRTAQSQNEFFITGNGGLPPRPGEPTPSSFTTGMVATTIQSTAPSPTLIPPKLQNNSQRPLQEANRWQHHTNGTVRLLSAGQSNIQQFPTIPCSNRVESSRWKPS